LRPLGSCLVMMGGRVTFGGGPSVGTFDLSSVPCEEAGRAIPAVNSAAMVAEMSLDLIERLRWL
jgi:hypothetical protein